MPIGQCSVDECQGDWRLTLGMCSAHYQRKRRYGDPTVRRRRPPGSCSVSGCGKASRKNGWCNTHAARAERNGGDPGPAHLLRVPGNQRHVVKAGYARIRIDEPHPRAYAGGWILEHIVVMERKLGRRLLPGENVHHLNGVRDDNRPENLELWVTMQPTGQRPSDLVEWAQEILRRYG